MHAQSRGTSSLAEIFFGSFANLFRARRAQRVPGRRLLFEPLERRILLSADALGAAESIASASPLVFDAPINAAADSYTLRFNAGSGDLELLNGTDLVASQALSATSAVIINGEDGQDDNLTIDFAFGGVFSLEDGILYNGGTGGIDKLTVTGGAFTNITHTFTDTGPGLSGNIAYEDGVDAPLTIAYTDLEPIDTTGSTAASMVFNLPGTNDIISLEDDGTIGNGISRLRSTSTPATFETTTFSNTATSVTINMGAGEDLITVNPLPDYHGALTINGNAGSADAVIFSGTQGLASLAVTVAGTIEINAAIVATGGGILLSGGTAVTGTAAGTITAGGVQIVSGNLSGAAGEVNLAGDIDTSGADSNSGLGGNGAGVEVITRGGAITLAGIDTSGGDSASGDGGDGGRILIDGGQVTLNGGLLAIGGSSLDAANGVFGDILVNQSLSTGGQAVTLAGGLIWGHTVIINGSSLTQDAGAAIIGIGNVTLAGVSGAVVLNDTVDFTASSSAIGLLKVSAASTLDINAAIDAFGGGVELSGGTAVRGTAAGTITTEIGGVMITSGNLSGAIGEVNLAGDIDTSGEDNDFGAGANGGGVQVFTRGGAITLAGIDTSGGDSVNLDGNGGDGGNFTIENGGGAVTLNGGVFARGGSGDTGSGAFGDILVNQSLSTGGQAVTLAGGLIWGHTVIINGSSLTQDAGAAIIGIGNVTLAGVSGAVVLNDTVDFTASSSAIGLLKVSAASTLDINAAIDAFGGGVELSGGTAVRGTAAGTITTEIGGVMITSGNLSGAIGEVNLAGDIDTSGEDNDFGAGANGGGVQVFTRGGAITLAGIDTSGGDSVNLDGNGGDGGNFTIENGGGAVTLNGGVFARNGSGLDGGAFGDILVNQSLSTGGQAVTLAGGLIWGDTITIKGSSLTQNAGAPIIGIGNVTLAGLSGAVVLNDTVNFTQGSSAIGLLKVSAGSTLDVNAAISTFGGGIELSGAEALRSTAAGTITTMSSGSFTPGVLATSGRFASGGVPGLAGEVDLAGSIDTTGADYDAGIGLPGGAAGGMVQVFGLGGPITVADIDTRGGSPISGPDGADGVIEIESGGGEIALTGSVHSGTSLVTLGASSVVVAGSATLNVELASNLTFTSFQVSDQITLDGTLHAELVDGFVPATGDRFRFMTFDSRAGDFDAAVLPAGFAVDQSDATDLELVFTPVAPAIVYVDDGFTGSAGTPIVDADPVAGGNQAAVVGVNAFATIQAGVNAVAQGGTVKVNSHGPNAAPTGAYAESVSITKALTLDGNAISGLAADVVIDPAAGNGITVSGTNADNFTIRDLRVTGGVDGINASGVGDLTITNVLADGNSNGINLTSVGAVTVEDVTASGNLNAGVSVNGAGSFADTDGIFNGNVNHGIQLTDIAGLVSLTRTTANDNDANNGGIGDGVNMTDGVDAGTEAIGSLQVTGGSFNDTVAGIQRFGIRVGKVGTSVVLDGVTATGNLNSGVEIQDGGTTASVSGTYSNNLGVGFSIASLSGSFTASGAFSGNGSHGLSLVDVDGAVTLTGVTANDNGGNGLNAVDGADLGTLAVGGLTVSGLSFNDTAAGNAQLVGVLVGDVNGDVVFNDAGASGNDAGGVQIGNVAGAVTFTSTSGASYSNNGGDGVSVASLTGALTVSGISASGNTGQGLEIGAGATAASISDGTFSGNTLGDGIALGTVGGAVVLTGVTASGNVDAGVSVNGAGSFADTDGIFNGNVNHGIQLTDIAGLVSLTRTTANDNDANNGGIGDGVNMTDGVDAGTEAIGSLQVTGGSFNDTVAGIQRFGIRVGKVGTSVVLDGVTATGNLNSGVEIQDGGTTASVSGTYSNNLGVGFSIASLSGSFTASGAFSGNGSHGLSLVDVDGAVTLTGVTANDNGGNGLNAVDGADLGTLAVGGLTVSGLSFNDTAAGNAQLVGVLVGDVNGDVVFNDAGASGNDAGGVQIGNVAGAVTFTSTSGASYSNNGGDGVSVASLTGALTVSGISASGNTGQGLEIGAGATAASISDGTFSGNTLGDGIALGTVGGAVVLTGVTASGNVDAGVSVNGAGSFADTDGIFNGNVNHGIQLTDIAGLVSLTRTTANDNDANNGGIGDGVNMTDGVDAGTEAIGSLQVTGGSFNDTVAGIQRFGIRVGKVGTSVVLDGVTATGNLNSGVEIQDGGTTATFTNGTYSSNGGDGINVASLATTLTVSGVTASNNAGDGLDISDGGTMAFLSGVFSNNASGRGVNLASDTIFVNGSLDSGTGAIVLTAPSGVFFTASAVLNVDLGGTSAGAFTTVTISDAVTLDGTLNAELVNGFTPVAGDRFRFMTFDSRTGFFAATNLPERFSVDQSDPTDLELVFNLPPDFVEVADRTVEEGHELRFTVTATDDDPQSSLVFSASGLPAGATFNPTTREFSWVPADDAVATVTFLVTDPHGATDTMEVKVTATNVAPTVDAGADQVVGLQKIDDHDKDEKHGKDKDKPEAEVSITAVFDDLGLRDTHTATINWGDGSATAVGKVIEPTATADGAVTGKHTYTRAGTYTVTVTVRDDDGGVRSDTLLVTVKQPVEKKNFDAKGDEYRLNEDAVLTVNAAHGVLDNDRSPAGVTLKARVVEGPEHGKLLFSADGSFTYVPDQDFHGKDSFWYEFTDGSNVSKAVEVKLDVKEVKDRHPRPCIDWDGDWKTPGSDSFMPFGKHWR